MFQSIRSVLAIPAAYNLWWRAVGGPAWAKVLVGQYIQPRAGARILEIGCGPGTIAGYLPDSEYVVFDMSSKYIDIARNPSLRAEFGCAPVIIFHVQEGKQ